MFDGRDVSRLTPRQRATLRAERIGFVFQAFNLLPRLTVMQNVLLPLAYLRTDAGRAVARHGTASGRWTCWRRSGLADRAGHKPNELSGGPAAAGGDRPVAGERAAS